MKLTDILKQILQEQEDRCKRIADRRYDKPSAYKSGAIVRCRQGKIWKDLKEEKEPNIQDIAYQQIPGLLEKGIDDLLDFLSNVMDETIEDVKTITNPQIERVPLSQITPSQHGEDYKNSSSEHEALEFQKILNGEKNIKNHREGDFIPILVNRRTNKIIDGNHKHYALSAINSPYAVVLYVNVSREYLKENKEPDITPDYFVSRIPFLKSFNDFSKENNIFFQKVDYNQDVELYANDQTFVLPQANTSMEFSYLISNPGKDRYRHSFNVKNALNIMWPKEKNDEENLMFRVLSMALNQIVNKLNYHKDIFTDTPEIPKDELDKVINDINKAYFDFEEFIENKLNISVSNPLLEDESLHKWFKRKGAPGKEGGWVDCNTCRNGKCKPCGRKEGEDRAKYPSCRPTPAQCKTKGKGKKWGKTK